MQPIVIYQENSKQFPSTTNETINQPKVKMSKEITHLDTGMWQQNYMNQVCPFIEEWKAE